MRNRLPIAEAREFYCDQSAVRALIKVNPRVYGFDLNDDLNDDRDAFVQKARDRAISTFAVVRDSKWFAKGEMGWWAAVHDEKQEGQWLREFNKLLDELPDDTLLTVVDCHI